MYITYVISTRIQMWKTSFISEGSLVLLPTQPHHHLQQESLFRHLSPSIRFVRNCSGYGPARNPWFCDYDITSGRAPWQSPVSSLASQLNCTETLQYKNYIFRAMDGSLIICSGVTYKCWIRKLLSWDHSTCFIRSSERWNRVIWTRLEEINVTHRENPWCQ